MSNYAVRSKNSMGADIDWGPLISSSIQLTGQAVNAYGGISQQQEITKQTGILADAQKFLASIGGGDQTDASGGMNMTPVIIGGVAVVGVGVAAFLILRKKKR